RARRDQAGTGRGLKSPFGPTTFLIFRRRRTEMTDLFEVGIITFGEISPDLTTGKVMSQRDRMAEIVEQAVVADEAGLDVYAVGEHHRSDFVASAPPVILAAVAARTKRIRLTSGVTVLGSED